MFGFCLSYLHYLSSTRVINLDLVEIIKKSGVTSVFIICFLFACFIWAILNTKLIREKSEAISYFKSIMDNSDESIIIIKENTIIYFNNTFLDNYYGLIHSQLQGLPINEESEKVSCL